MIIFRQKVDRRSRGEMIEFLREHFRYNTMNGWNNSTSYAQNVKIHRLGLERDVTDKLYDLIQTVGFYDTINDLIHEFGKEHDYMWQAGWNGRNSGYLVLYQGGQKPSGYKSYCASCGQRNYTSVAETGTVCGRCHKPYRADYSQTHMSVYISGQSVDQGELFGEWDMDSLRNRVELICEFDSLADRIVAEAVYMAENYDAVEETVYVPQTRLVMTGI